MQPCGFPKRVCSFYASDLMGCGQALPLKAAVESLTCGDLHGDERTVGSLIQKLMFELSTCNANIYC